MLTSAQIRTIKLAQRQCALGDADYREALAAGTGLADCTSSTDRRLGDAHFDRLLGYLEAIYWRAVDLRLADRQSETGDRPELRSPNPELRPWSPFRVRGYWARKNSGGTTSRDRYAADELQRRCTDLETELQHHGRGPEYCAEIKRKTGPGWAYVAALERTLKLWRAVAVADGKKEQTKRIYQLR